MAIDELRATRADLHAFKHMLETDRDLEGAETLSLLTRLADSLNELPESMQLVLEPSRMALIQTLKQLLERQNIRMQARHLILSVFDYLDPEANFTISISEPGKAAMAGIDAAAGEAQKKIRSLDEALHADTKLEFRLDPQELFCQKQGYIDRIMAALRIYGTAGDHQMISLQQVMPKLGQGEKETVADHMLLRQREMMRESKFIAGRAEEAIELIMEIYDAFEREYGCGNLQ